MQNLLKNLKKKKYVLCWRQKIVSSCSDAKKWKYLMIKCTNILRKQKSTACVPR